MEKWKSFLGTMREKSFVPLKYLASSVAAFGVNYVLLLVLDKQIPSVGSMELAALIAWIVSSFLNFTLNRKWVFRANGSYSKAFLEYYSLATVVFCIKTFGFLELLTRVLHLQLWFAAPLAEAILFICNYFIQKKWIFGRKNTEGENVHPDAASTTSARK